MRCKLKSVVARITTYTSNDITQQNLLLQVHLKNLLKNVDASSTCCNRLLQLATTKFCCLTMFGVGGNTCNNAFQFATQQCSVQVEQTFCPYYRAFITSDNHTVYLSAIWKDGTEKNGTRNYTLAEKMVP